MIRMKNIPIKTWLLLLFVLGMLVRVMVSIFFGENRIPYYEYMTIAENLLNGQGYSFDEWGRTILQPSSFLPPIYIYWCTFFMWLSPHDFLIMYIAQAVVAASGCFPAFLIGRTMFSERVGLIFAFIYVFFPELIYLHSRPVSEFLYVVFALWMIYGYLRQKDGDLEASNAWVRAFALGVLGGITILVKEAATVILAAIMIALLIRRPSIKTVRHYLLPMAAGTLLIMSPWIIRNAIVHKQFVPIRTGYGITLWLANHHGATGTDKTLEGEYVLAKMDSSYLNQMNRMLPKDEQERDKVYIAEVRRFIAHYPMEYLRLCGKRLQYYLWFDETHPIAKSIIYRFGYIFAMVFGVCGFLIAYRHSKLDPIIVLIYLGYLLLYIPVLILPRYRIMSVILLLLLSAYTIEFLWSTLYRNRPTTDKLANP